MSQPAPSPQPRVERSWAITAMIVVGLAVLIFGIIAAVMGLSGSSALDIKVGGAELKTTGLGMICIVVGVVLAALPFVKPIRGDGLGPHRA